MKEINNKQKKKKKKEKERKRKKKVENVHWDELYKYYKAHGNIIN